MRPTRLLIAAAALLPLAAPFAAHAQPLVQSQEGIALQNEILQLQQQVQQLQAQGGGSGSSSLGGSAPPPAANSGSNSLVASLLTQVQQLQAQVQTLNGQVSDLQHQVDTQNAQTQKDIGDLKFQLSNGGAAAPGAAAAATPGAPAAPAGGPQSLTAGMAPAAPSTPPPAPPTDPKTALKAALDAYTARDYAQAQSLAQSIVTNNKAAPEAYRAQYLVAQSLSAQGKPQDAAIAFDNTYNMNRTGTYAPHALLGLASSLSAINQNSAACDTIASLNSQFTNPSPGMKAQIDAVSKRAHCG